MSTLENNKSTVLYTVSVLRCRKIGTGPENLRTNQIAYSYNLANNIISLLLDIRNEAAGNRKAGSELLSSHDIVASGTRGH
jgi:hypothetical protein